MENMVLTKIFEKQKKTIIYKEQKTGTGIEKDRRTNSSKNDSEMKRKKKKNQIQT